MAGILVVWLLGFSLEVIGLLAAVVGFQRTWAEFRQNERFLDPVAQWLGRSVRSVRELLRRLRRRIDVRVVAGTAHGSATSFGAARVTKSYGPLPSIEQDPLAFSEMVQARLAELLEHSQEVEYRLGDHMSELHDELKKIDSSLAGRISTVEQETKHIAVGGLRLQAVGWMFVFVGLFIQGLAQLLQFLTSS